MTKHIAETLCMHAEIWPKSELLLEVAKLPILCLQWEKVQTSLSQWEGLIGSLALKSSKVTPTLLTKSQYPNCVISFSLGKEHPSCIVFSLLSVEGYPYCDLHFRITLVFCRLSIKLQLLTSVAVKLH